MNEDLYLLMHQLTEAAEQEDAQAQFKLGQMYWRTYDTHEAVHWTRKAAKQGHLEAKFKLSIMYYVSFASPYSEKGELEMDEQEAIDWLYEAAEKGHVQAQSMLGCNYYYGIVPKIKQNYSEALRWSLKAAEQGGAESQHLLGDMHYKGRGVKEDQYKAYIWFSIALESGYGTANMVLRGCSWNLSSEEIQSAKDEAIRRSAEIENRKNSEEK